jgi:hypothetical protein
VPTLYQTVPFIDARNNKDALSSASGVVKPTKLKLSPIYNGLEFLEPDGIVTVTYTLDFPAVSSMQSVVWNGILFSLR